MSDLTNLIEWNQFADERKTLLEALTILNNRHREAVGNAEAELSVATAERDDFRGQVEAVAELSGKALRVLGALGCDASTTAEQAVEKVEAMREAIKEAYDAIDEARECVFGEVGALLT